MFSHQSSRSTDIDFKEYHAEIVDAQIERIGEEFKRLEAVREELGVLVDTQANHSPSSSIEVEDSCRENPTNNIEDYAKTFLTEEEAGEAIAFLSTVTFSKVKDREVASFGERYSYTGAPSENTKEIPAELQSLISKIKQYGSFDDVNQIVINKFNNNTSCSCLPEHSDDEPSLKPRSSILTISLGDTREVIFKDKCTGRDVPLSVANRSLYIMAQESQIFWTHRMEKEESAKETRYSITFRSVGSN